MSKFTRQSICNHLYQEFKSSENQEILKNAYALYSSNENQEELIPFIGIVSDILAKFIGFTDNGENYYQNLYKALRDNDYYELTTDHSGKYPRFYNNVEQAFLKIKAYDVVKEMDKLEIKYNVSSGIEISIADIKSEKLFSRIGEIREFNQNISLKKACVKNLQKALVDIGIIKTDANKIGNIEARVEFSYNLQQELFDELVVDFSEDFDYLTSTCTLKKSYERKK